MRVQALLPAVFVGVLVLLIAPATDPIEFAVEAAPENQDAGNKAGAALDRLHALFGMEASAKAPGASYRGDDSCRWANDGECDDPRFGTGACRTGTDYSDCWRIAQGVEDDSCRWADDGECDEPGFGTGACTQATDHSDCGDIGYLRFQTDDCITAFDGVCNEPGDGDGTCAARTDRADCIGRDRPLQIIDHFFGRDDRMLFDTTEPPWSEIGLLTLASDGSGCTATLVAEDVVITAAHCIKTEVGTVDARGEFATAAGLPGGIRTARIVGYLIGEAPTPKADESESDWALLRLDQPLGRNLGYVGVRPLADYSFQQALLLLLYQAGYSWDTGDHLSGSIGCSILRFEGVNTLRHDCDTTHGDSGSPLMVEDGGAYYIIAIDSAFDVVPNAPARNVATRADAWAPLLADFAAGRTGTTIGPTAKPPAK